MQRQAQTQTQTQAQGASADAESSQSTRADGEKARVWYFAYGSNMKSSVMERRGVELLAVERVAVPSHQLVFDVFGVPYSEPAMASIAPWPQPTSEMSRAGRHDITTTTTTITEIQMRDAGRKADHHQVADKDVPSVHGVAYLLSTSDYAKLTISEGAGVAYAEVQLDAQVLSHDSGHRGPLNLAPRILPRLLIEGAEEHRLPASYREYLSGLPCYRKELSSIESIGARLFLAFWMPLLSWVMRRIKATATKTGRPQEQMGATVWLVFNLMWWYHDAVHSRIWGRGGGR